MPEIIELLNKISAAKGAEFTEGLVAGINLTTPAKPDTEPEEENETASK